MSLWPHDFILCHCKWVRLYRVQGFKWQTIAYSDSLFDIYQASAWVCKAENKSQTLLLRHTLSWYNLASITTWHTQPDDDKGNATKFLFLIWKAPILVGNLTRRAIFQYTTNWVLGLQYIANKPVSQLVSRYCTKHCSHACKMDITFIGIWTLELSHGLDLGYSMMLLRQYVSTVAAYPPGELTTSKSTQPQGDTIWVSKLSPAWPLVLRAAIFGCKLTPPISMTH